MDSYDADETQMSQDDKEAFNDGICSELATANKKVFLDATKGSRLDQKSPRVWCVGDSCLALFSGDGIYREATIKKIHRDSSPFTAHVHYLRYGSDEDELIPLSSIRSPSLITSIKQKEIKNTFKKQEFISKAFSDEKDRYMKQKYDSSGEDSVTNVVQNPRRSKKKRLDFTAVSLNCTKSFSNKKTVTDSQDGLHKPESNARTTERHNKGKQPVLGFSDHDMEKPHFDMKPMGEKIPFFLSNEGETPVAQIPSPMNQFLRDYQREGVVFMYKKLKRNEGCILGDDMGLGKTVQVIALISAILGKTGTKEDAMPSYFKKKKAKDAERGENRPFLIVSPSSVLFNWEDELVTWGYFKIARFHGTSKVETMEKAKRGKLEVVLTTYETFRVHVDLINELSWLCIVMDEAHRVKEPNSMITQAAKKVKCRCRMGLSGTPMQNNLQELWCLLDWANPGCLGSLESFTDEFATPIKLGQRFDATKRELATARKKQQEFGVLKDKWILRRTKELLEGQLPRKDERAVFAPLSELQVSLYEAILDFPSPNYVITSDAPCDCKSGKQRASCCYKLDKDESDKQRKEIFHIITLLRKVSNHAALLLPYHKASSQQKEMALSICQKLFHKFPVLQEVYKNGSFAKMCDSKFSGKLRIVDKLLTVMEQEKDKVLLFSTSVQLLNILEAYTISKGYDYRRLDGETKPQDRMGVIRDFNNHADVFICLVSTKAGGVGLNFTGANVVIIFDAAWNPSHDNQAQDRAYRIGQRRNVRVYRLIAEGSIEENIYLRQVYKQQLSNMAIHTSNERRLFKAVAGCKTKRGELFGLKNLFMLRKRGSNLTGDLLKRTEKIESGIRMVDFDIPESKNTIKSMEDKDDLDEYEETQCIEDLESDLEEFASNTCNLYSDAEEDGIAKDDAISSLSSAEEAETPLVWKKSRKYIMNRKPNVSLRDKNKGQNFTKISKEKKGGKCRIQSSSEESTSSMEEDKLRLNYQRKAKAKVSFNSSCTETKRKSSVEAMDNLLDECGVTYTSTAKNVLSKSAAEEQMTKEAINDVFWNGMYSQQPANFLEPSSSEESDNIPCSSKAKKTTEHQDSKGEFKRQSIPCSAKRIFERIGNEMFLIGETPPLLRKQQFEEIAKYNGYSSTLAFAKEIVQSSENEARRRLTEFYQNKEPSVVQIPSFNSIFLNETTVRSDFPHGSRPSKRPGLMQASRTKANSKLSGKKQASHDDKKIICSRQSFPHRRKKKFDNFALESHLKLKNEASDGELSNSSAEKSFLTLKRQFKTEVRPVPEANLVGKAGIATHGSCIENKDDFLVVKEIIEETQVPGLSFTDNLRRSTDAYSISHCDHRMESGGHVSRSESESSDKSDGILHEMMFCPVKKTREFKQTGSDIENTTGPLSDILTGAKSIGYKQRLATDANIEESWMENSNNSNKDSLSCSVLDELMDTGMSTTKCDAVDTTSKELYVDNTVKPGALSHIPNVFSESQSSVSILDELLG